MKWVWACLFGLITCQAWAESIDQRQLQEVIGAIKSVGQTSALEQFYWLSQIAILVFVAVAGFVAYSQVQTVKLFELLKYIEDLEIRKARRIVRREIGKNKRDGEKWWDKHETWEEAASTVCASYDVVGRVLMSNYVAKKWPALPISPVNNMFIEHWARSIVANYRILDTFLAERRENGNAYEGFEWLYRRCECVLKKPT